MKYSELSSVEVFVNLFPFHEKLATLLFESTSDVKDFTGKFYKSNKYEIDDLLDFRQYKLEKSNATLAYFLDKCDEDLKSAFEIVFIQSFDDDSINLVKESLHSNSTTLEHIFREFQKNIDINILKHVISI